MSGTITSRPEGPGQPARLDVLAQHWPVLVVGAGPAGLVAAITLARQGIRCLVLNRRTSVSSLPRATGLSLRTMELLRSWGLEDEVRAGGDEVELQMLLAPTLARAIDGATIDVGFPTSADSARLSPTRPACVPQDQLESVLLRHLETWPAVHVARGIAVQDVRPIGSGCEVVLRSVATGSERTVQARYVIGADGANSLVRGLVGIATAAFGTSFEAFSATIHAPLWDLVGDRRFVIYSVDAPIAASFLPAGRGDRWIYSFRSGDGSAGGIGALTHPQLIDRIRTAAGAPGLPVRVVDVRRFSFSARLAERMRSDDVFLVGDAAHRLTPRGGMGLNTAVGDGFNLAWKLGWVLNGWAPETLLRSFETERRPVAEHNVARSADPGGTRRDVGDELHVDLGGRIDHQWITRTGRRPISTLDLVSPGLTRIRGHGRQFRGSGSHPGVAAPIVDRRVGSHAASALFGADPDGLLIRPDGVVWDSRLGGSACTGSAATTTGGATAAASDCLTGPLPR